VSFVGGNSGQWRVGVPTYGQAAYRGVYPGIDLIDYGNQMSWTGASGAFCSVVATSRD
jgi:hypothetical protein